MASISELLEGRYDAGSEVELRGWIHRTRSSGKIVFIVLRDSTGTVQVTVKKGNVTDDAFEDAKTALVESSVLVRGEAHEDQRAPGGVEVRATAFEVFNFAEPFPITEDRSDELLMDNRHLWIRSTEMQSILKVRSSVFRALRDWFYERDFHETQSPSFVSGACEGGSTLFKVPYFRDREVFLTQSWQLYAEALVMSLEKIFTIAPSFRAEKSRTRRHLSEFWHFEAELAWSGNEDIMDLEERMVSDLVALILDEHGSDIEELGRDISVLEACKPPFERITYQEAEEMLAAKGMTPKTPGDLGYREEKVLTEEFDKPFFITSFPRDAKPFYHRPDPDDPDVVLCNDLLAPEGYGEIIGGGERIFDKEELLQRIDENGLDREPYEWYIDLRRYGGIPHSGFGLGIDRLVAWITGQSHIKYVIPFPRTMRRIYP